MDRSRVSGGWGEDGESARWELCQQSSWRDCIVCLLASAAVAVTLFAFWFMLLVFYAIFIFYAVLPTPTLLLRLLPLHPLAILKDLHS